MATDPPPLEQHVIYSLGSRQVSLLGMDRILFVILSMAAVMLLMTGFSLLQLIVVGGMYTGGMLLLQLAFRHDPLLRQIYQVTRRYRSFYRASSLCSARPRRIQSHNWIH